MAAFTSLWRTPNYVRRLLLWVALSMVVIPMSARAQTDSDALFKDLRWRNIGPANMAGRVTDIEAVDADFTTVFVGAASGRRVEVGERGNDVGAHLRELRHRQHRGHRDLPAGSEHRLGGHGRVVYAQQRRVGRRRLQVNGTGERPS